MQYVEQASEIQIHTDESPFCTDLSCGCHLDDDLLSELAEAYLDGLVTADDAVLIATGQTIWANFA